MINLASRREFQRARHAAQSPTVQSWPELALSPQVGLKDQQLVAEFNEMIEVEKIREGLEVVGSDGLHVGTVDSFSGTLLKLKKNDPASGGLHHYLGSDFIASINERIVLRISAGEARAQWSEAA